MKLWNPHSYGRGTIFVAPGAEHPDNPAWVHPVTKEPIMFTVKFSEGIAEVPADLGNFLIESGAAALPPNT